MQLLFENLDDLQQLIKYLKQQLGFNKFKQVVSDNFDSEVSTSSYVYSSHNQRSFNISSLRGKIQQIFILAKQQDETYNLIKIPLSQKQLQEVLVLAKDIQYIIFLLSNQKMFVIFIDCHNNKQIHQYLQEQLQKLKDKDETNIFNRLQQLSQQLNSQIYQEVLHFKTENQVNTFCMINKDILPYQSEDIFNLTQGNYSNIDIKILCASRLLLDYQREYNEPEEDQLNQSQRSQRSTSEQQQSQRSFRRSHLNMSDLVVNNSQKLQQPQKTSPQLRQSWSRNVFLYRDMQKTYYRKIDPLSLQKLQILQQYILQRIDKLQNMKQEQEKRFKELQSLKWNKYNKIDQISLDIYKQLLNKCNQHIIDLEQEIIEKQRQLNQQLFNQFYLLESQIPQNKYYKCRKIQTLNLDDILNILKEKQKQLNQKIQEELRRKEEQERLLKEQMEKQKQLEEQQRLEQEKLEKEKQEKLKKERLEKERKEKEEKERQKLEQEKQEQEKLRQLEEQKKKEEELERRKKEEELAKQKEQQEIQTKQKQLEQEQLQQQQQQEIKQNIETEIKFNKDLRVFNVYNQKITFLQHNNYNILVMLFYFDQLQNIQKQLTLNGIYYFMNLNTQQLIKLWCDCDKTITNQKIELKIVKATQKDKIVDLWITRQCSGYHIINIYIQDILNVDKQNMTSEQEQILRYINTYDQNKTDIETITDKADIKFIEIGQSLQETKLNSLQDLKQESGYLIPLTNNLCYGWLGEQTNQQQQQIYEQTIKKYDGINEIPQKESLVFKLLFEKYLEDAKMVKQQVKQEEPEKEIEYQYNLEFRKQQEKQEQLYKLQLYYHIYNEYTINPVQVEQKKVYQQGQELNVLELSSHQCHFFQFFDQQTQQVVIYIWIGYLCIPKQAFYFQAEFLLNNEYKQLKAKNQLKLYVIDQFYEPQLFKYQYDRIIYKETIQQSLLPQNYTLYDQFSTSNITNRYQIYSIIDCQLYQVITQITHIFDKKYVKFQNENLIIYDKIEQICYSDQEKDDLIELIHDFSLFEGKIKQFSQISNSAFKIQNLDKIQENFKYFSVKEENQEVNLFNSFKPEFPPQSQVGLLAHSDENTFILINSHEAKIQKFLESKFQISNQSLKLKLSIFKPFRLIEKISPYKSNKLVKLRYILDTQLDQMRQEYWNNKLELSDIKQQQQLILDVFKYNKYEIMKEQLKKYNLE